MDAIKILSGFFNELAMSNDVYLLPFNFITNSYILITFCLQAISLPRMEWPLYAVEKVRSNFRTIYWRTIPFLMSYGTFILFWS